MLKQTVQSFKTNLKELASSSSPLPPPSSSSSRRGGVHIIWNHLYGNSVRSMRSTQTDRTTSYSAPREKVDCLVIGAGVVGIAVARALALKGREVLVIESAPTFGTSTSSRNSQVIHAGIYYPPNSYKAIFCVRGREMLYEYCSKNDIPHEQIGKLVVATRSSEIPKLNDILNRGIQNGVDTLRMMDGVDAMKMEPELQCVKAILSPLSGIVDSHSLMLALVGEAENHRTTFTYNSTVIGGHLEGNQICLHISETKHLRDWNGTSVLHPELVLSPKLIVNSAGLSAPALTKRFTGLHSAVIPSAYYARGCYFTLSNTKATPFRHLIYPIPEDGGLGVHVTLDLNGQVKFGPDVEWIDGIDDISSFLNMYFLIPCHLHASDLLDTLVRCHALPASYDP